MVEGAQLITRGKHLSLVIFQLCLVLGLIVCRSAWADDDDGRMSEAVEDQVIAIANFSHDLSEVPAYSDEELEARLHSLQEFEIPHRVADLFFRLLDRASELSNQIGHEAFDEEVKSNTIYVKRPEVGRAEMTILNGQHRVRVVDDQSGNSWFFFLESDDLQSEHANKIRNRQMIMSGADKISERRAALRKEYEKNGLAWYQFVERSKVRSNFKEQNYRRLYLPGRDSHFVTLATNADYEYGSELRVTQSEEVERPFQRMFFGVGYPIIPWWQTYAGALKSKLNWRLGAVCASLQAGMTCALGYAKDIADPHVEFGVLQSLQWEAMLLSIAFGGGIATSAGSYKEWVRLGPETRQWLKLFTVGAAFGYVFMYFVKYGADASAFNLFDSSGNLLTEVTLNSGAVVAGGVLAHVALFTNTTVNQIVKKVVYDYAHNRREMRVDKGDHDKGLLKGSSKSDSMMQMLYQFTYLAKIGDLGHLMVPLSIPFIALSYDLPLGKAMLFGSVPAIQLFTVWWNKKKLESASDRMKPLWEKKYQTSVKRWWMLSGAPLLPFKITYDAFAGTPDTIGNKIATQCSSLLGHLSRKEITPRSPF